MLVVTHRQQHQAHFAAQLAREDAERQAAAAFRARPLPTTLEQPQLPVCSVLHDVDAIKAPSQAPVPPPPLTVQQPFALRSVKLHEAEVWRRAQDALKEEEARKRAAEFRARPVVHTQEPFVPQRSDKPLTVAEHVTLRSDQRAAQRQAFEVRLQAEARARAEQEAKEAEARAAREAAELRAYRKSLEYRV